LNLNFSNSTVQTFVVIGLLFVGLLILLVMMRVLTRVSVIFEAFSLLEEPLGEYLGNPRLVMLGCVVVLLGIVGCCVLAFILIGALLTCGTAFPSGLCHLIGH